MTAPTPGNCQAQRSSSRHTNSWLGCSESMTFPPPKYPFGVIFICSLVSELLGLFVFILSLKPWSFGFGVGFWGFFFAFFKDSLQNPRSGHSGGWASFQLYQPWQHSRRDGKKRWEERPCSSSPKWYKCSATVIHQANLQFKSHI